MLPNLSLLAPTSTGGFVPSETGTLTVQEQIAENNRRLKPYFEEFAREFFNPKKRIELDFADKDFANGVELFDWNRDGIDGMPFTARFNVKFKYAKTDVLPDGEARAILLTVHLKDMQRQTWHQMMVRRLLRGNPVTSTRLGLEEFVAAAVELGNADENTWNGVFFATIFAP